MTLLVRHEDAAAMLADTLCGAFLPSLSLTLTPRMALSSRLFSRTSSSSGDCPASRQDSQNRRHLWKQAGISPGLPTSLNGVKPTEGLFCPHPGCPPKNCFVYPSSEWPLKESFLRHFFQSQVLYQYWETDTYVLSDNKNIWLTPFLLLLLLL